MQNQVSYGFIHIGLLIRLLVNIAKSDSKKFTLRHMDLFKKELEDAGFEVSLAYIQGVSYQEIIESLYKIEGDDEHIGDKLSTEISYKFMTIENIVFAESNTKKIYVLPTRRFNTDFLLKTPEKLFAKGIYDKLNEIAKYDISSASKCLLFGEATAAAFHILRGTESVLKQYYFHHRRQNRLSKPMWANILDQLKAKTRNKPPATLLSALDIIRTAYRNPTQHPEAIYTIDSAQDVFGVCLDAIGKMAQEF